MSTSRALWATMPSPSSNSTTRRWALWPPVSPRGHVGPITKRKRTPLAKCAAVFAVVAVDACAPPLRLAA